MGLTSDAGYLGLSRSHLLRYFNSRVADWLLANSAFAFVY